MLKRGGLQELGIKLGVMSHDDPTRGETSKFLHGLRCGRSEYQFSARNTVDMLGPKIARPKFGRTDIGRPNRRWVGIPILEDHSNLQNLIAIKTKAGGLDIDDSK